MTARCAAPACRCVTSCRAWACDEQDDRDLEDSAVEHEDDEQDEVVP